MFFVNGSVVSVLVAKCLAKSSPKYDAAWSPSFLEVLSAAKWSAKCMAKAGVNSGSMHDGATSSGDGLSSRADDRQSGCGGGGTPAGPQTLNGSTFRRDDGQGRKGRVSHPKGLEPLLTLSQVAELLAIPVRTLYTWRYRGEGPPALKIGGHVRYDPAALRRWLDAIAKQPG